MVKHRCGFCHKVLRADGSCGYEKCPRYVPEKTEELIEEVQEETPAAEATQEEPAENEA